MHKLDYQKNVLSSFKQEQKKLIIDNSMPMQALVHAIEAFSSTTLTLVLSYCSFIGKRIQALKQGLWKDLTALYLENSGVTDTDMRALVEIKCPQLKRLHLNQNLLTHELFSILTSSQWSSLTQIIVGVSKLQSFPTNSLKILDLSSNNLTPKSSILLSELSLPMLQKLFLSHNQLTSDSVILMCKCSKFSNLTHLSLGSFVFLQVEQCKITDISVIAHIANNFPQIQVICLQNNMLNQNTIGDQPTNWGEQGHTGSFCRLKELNLGNCHLGDRGIRFLGVFQYPELTDLYLWSNNITDAGIRWLSRLQMPNLQDLDLWQNQITDRGVQFLSQHQNLQKIVQITLWSNPDITSIGILPLSKISRMGSNQALSVFISIDQSSPLSQRVHNLLETQIKFITYSDII